MPEPPDSELSTTPVYMLRQYLRYWKWPKSVKHHFEATGETVDRHAEIERLTEAINSRRDKGPGRPLGHKLNEESRMRARHAAMEKAGKKTGVRPDGTPYKESPPPCDDHRVSWETRDDAFQRDGRKCAGCHEYYRIRYWKKLGEPGKKYWTPVKNGKETVEIQHHQDIKMWLVPRGDPLNKDHLWTLCHFCRKTAEMGGLDMIGIRVTIELEA